MTKSTNDQFIPLVKELQEFAYSQVGSMTILRTLGYGLLLLAFFDIVEMLIPSNFMNAAWEFQTFGALVERVPVPLIGLALVFYGELHSRSKWEFFSLKFLSWLSLLLALLFIFLIPLGVLNTVRLSKRSVAQVSNVSQQQIAQAEQIEQQQQQHTSTPSDHENVDTKKQVENIQFIDPDLMEL